MYSMRVSVRDGDRLLAGIAVSTRVSVRVRVRVRDFVQKSSSQANGKKQSYTQQARALFLYLIRVRG